MYTPTYILNQSEVVIMFSSGAGVEVVENSGFLTARVYMPWSFIVNLVFFSQLTHRGNIQFFPEQNTRSVRQLELGYG